MIHRLPKWEGRKRKNANKNRAFRLRFPATTKNPFCVGKRVSLSLIQEGVAGLLTHLFSSVSKFLIANCNRRYERIVAQAKTARQSPSVSARQSFPFSIPVTVASDTTRYPSLRNRCPPG